MQSGIFRKARYLNSAHTLAQLPPDQGVEIAFAGRSNSGKSSVINTLTGNRTLARTSKTPGRTQQINFFSLDHGARLVDLPGYGYARVPETMRKHWAKTLAAYLETRKSLQGLVLILDIRRGAGEFDMQLLEWAHIYGLPLQVLMNKADKLSRQAAGTARDTLRRNMDARGWPDTGLQLFSAMKKTGTEELEARLETWLRPL